MKKMRPVEKAVIVTGRNLDIDAVVGTWLFCLANQLQWWDPEQVRYLFVEPGERRHYAEVQQQLGLDKKWTVVHIDTGRIHNPSQFYFDHHSEDGNGGKQPSSSASQIMKAYPNSDHVVEAIMLFAHWIDNAQGDKAQESCRGDFGFILNPTPKIVAALCGEDFAVPPAVAMQTGLGNIHAFYASCLRERGRFAARAEATIKQICDGFVLFGTTPDTTKNFRNFAMRKMSRVHVVVAEYPNEGQGRIGISCIRDLFDGSRILDLSAIRDQLRGVDPDVDLFLHDSGKFLYIERTEKLTLETIWGVVEPLVMAKLPELYTSQVKTEASRISRSAQRAAGIAYHYLGLQTVWELFDQIVTQMIETFNLEDSGQNETEED